MEYIFYIGLIVLAGMSLESITGFGATIIALPFLSMLISVKIAVPLMSLVSFAFGLYIFIINHKYIDKKVLKAIIIFSGLGMPLGMAAFSYLPERLLKLILGVFVTGYAIRSLIQCLKKNHKKEKKTLPEIIYRIALFAGGVFHGAFAAGGPLMIVYVSKRIHDKTVYRATMTCVWVIFNFILLIKNILIGGIITAGFVKMWLCCLPFLVIGAMIGSRMHKKVSIEAFSLLTNVILLFAGVSTLVLQMVA